jgi:P27 family predicted phage terminase small subunit
MHESKGRPKRPTIVAPSHLSEASQALWVKLAIDFSLAGDDHAELLLTAGLEARDRMIEARDRLRKDGVTIPDRTGGLKVHPCVIVERDSHARMLQSFKALRLDIEPSIHVAPGRKGH